MDDQRKIPDNHTHLIDAFCEITSSSRDEALFFLESHNFDLDPAVSTFLEITAAAADGDGDGDGDGDLTAAAAAATATTAIPTCRNVSPASPSPSASASPSSSASRSRSPSPRPLLRRRSSPYNLRSRRPMDSSSSRKPPGRRTGGIHTLSDLNRRNGGASDSDSDEPQEYYTGGEKSGMLVRDPSKVNDVDAIFNQARQSGAIEPADDIHPRSTSRSFTGTGRLLSGDTVPSASQQPEIVTHNIVFWSNGFTVDDGPLRMLDDPENASFLESIRRSECPKELEPANRKKLVHVNLSRKDENCPVPEKCCMPFQGTARTLGGSSSSSVAEPAEAPLDTPPPTSVGLVVDTTSPSTSIQLRLADGTRMVSRFNHHHTIRDIRAFIDVSRPGGTRTYQLQTVGFPPKQLADLEQTIEQAGLANSVVIQRL